MTDTALLIKDVDKFYGPIDYGVHAVKINAEAAAWERGLRTSDPSASGELVAEESNPAADAPCDSD